MTDTTINPAEAAKFERMAEEWWDPTGKFKPLHKFNPVRLSYIRDHAILHFGKDGGARRPLEGLRILDIGCGGGLLCEPMARLGATVTGIDVVERNIAVAQLHAAQSGLAIDYRTITAEALAAEGDRFDIVLNMEVVEHVDNVPLYMKSCADPHRPGRPPLYRNAQPHPARPCARRLRRREHPSLAAPRHPRLEQVPHPR